jgi:homopolymeric O-antigen transport system permease protein
MIETQNPTIAASRSPEELQAPAQLRSPSTSAAEAEPNEIVIRAQTGWISIDWAELFAYRELLFFLVWRDISARYKQTILGPAWAVIQPLLLMAIFTVVSLIVRIPTPEIDGVPMPYPVFVFAGLIPWTLFSQGMPQSALSLVSNQNMMTKVYFPRIFLPVSAAMVFLVDLTISLGIYSVILLYYRTAPAWTVVFLPVLILLTVIATLSIGILLASLTLFYRDFRHIVPFLVQIMMYVSPVMYSGTKFTNQLVVRILSLNPMFGIIDAYRACILGADLNWGSLLISSTSAILLFGFALFYFRKTERWFADFA